VSFGVNHNHPSDHTGLVQLRLSLMWRNVVVKRSTLYLQFMMKKLVVFVTETLIKVITKLPNSEQSYKGKVKTHNYINRQDQSTTGKLWKP
jgi:hypothetical protein